MENLSSAIMLWALIYFFVSWSIFLTVASWIVYEKADQPGWGIFIPIYNMYLLHVIAGKPGWWLIFWFIPIPLVSLIIAVIIFLGVAENFGKGPLFGIGLVFLSPILYPVLAFGDAEYEG